MLRKFLLIPLLSIFFISNSYADTLVPPTPTTLQYLNAITLFNGDMHGQFKDDFVAILSDDSAWKVHPKDKEKFAKWGINDIVHIGVRTSFYWFKREHKFELHNMTRRESVRVMLVQLPYNALTIRDTFTYLSGQYLVPYTITDSQGNSYTYYYWVYTYDKKLYLDDGSVWTIKTESVFDNFTIGTRVYLGVNHKSSGLSYFLTSGIEREGTYDWAYQ